MRRWGRGFVARGHELTADPAEAAQIVVNTCTVTQAAGADSRGLVRELGRAAPGAAITVTGLPRGAGAGRAGRATECAAGGGQRAQGADCCAAGWRDGGGRAGADAHARRGRAHAGLCEGAGWLRPCLHVLRDDDCARGRGRSRAVADVVHELRQLRGLGIQEAVLSGVQLGSYGRDLGMARGLETLLRAALADTDLPRLRLSSLEPWDLRPDFFELWQDSRLCRHLHLPLQSRLRRHVAEDAAALPAGTRTGRCWRVSARGCQR